MTDRWMDGHCPLDRRMDGFTDGQMDGWIYRGTDGWMDIHYTGGLMDGQDTEHGREYRTYEYVVLPDLAKSFNN